MYIRVYNAIICSLLSRNVPIIRHLVNSRYKIIRSVSSITEEKRHLNKRRRQRRCVRLPLGQDIFVRVVAPRRGNENIVSLVAISCIVAHCVSAIYTHTTTNCKGVEIFRGLDSVRNRAKWSLDIRNRTGIRPISMSLR